MNEETIKYWTDLSNYDLETANAMLITKRFLYVGFMAHQTIEKILKAYFVKLRNEVPLYTHNLLLLAEETELQNELSEKQLELLEKLIPLNIEARYPKYKEELLRSLTQEKCELILKETKEFQEWIIAKLQKN
ncbi:MAG: DNA-binding protein [Planctomycetes bacterium GWF2_40_8]|nr:MAG: DNA-binding protein [Planctomycetes bacterium GWF2_40_8]OHB89974.1 MAG: DNA-binding protein [Planctomycetes bacterium RIFCSPHIGHO2_02_FULL_40_12]OHC04935.1 MAG: DNA-binding protein [Planctomycetes bacterium RIFCSPLOWO2_12_FULL_40_19]